MKNREKLKRRSQKFAPQALKGQEKIRRKTGAVQARDVAGKQVRRRWKGELIKMSHREIRGRARAAMTAGAQGVRGILSGGLASPDNGEGRSPRTGRRGPEDRCRPPMRNVPTTRRWNMRRETHLRDLKKGRTTLACPSSRATKRSYGVRRKSGQGRTGGGSSAKTRKRERARQN